MNLYSCYFDTGTKGKDGSRIPRPCRKGSSSGGNRQDYTSVSVTQAVQFSMRKYVLEIIYKPLKFTKLKLDIILLNRYFLGII
jgi:hypothetical protein